MGRMKKAVGQLAKSVRAVFEKTPDVMAIDDTSVDDAEQQRLVVDRNKAMLAGVSPQQIAAHPARGIQWC
jgi:multidrug efflux pump subunit AcrB